jgi:hypothetical protein
MRSELGDTVEKVAHRVDAPAQVKAKKEDTIARLQATTATMMGSSSDRVASLIVAGPVVARCVVEQMAGRGYWYASSGAHPCGRDIGQCVGTSAQTVCRAGRGSGSPPPGRAPSC